MPTINDTLFANLAKTIFKSGGTSLPGDWDDMGPQFADAFPKKELSVMPNPPGSSFREPTLNDYHVKVVRVIGKNIEDYIEDVCKSISMGIDFWMKLASIVGSPVAGPAGTVLPGNVIGPDVKPIVFANLPLRTEYELKYAKAISDGFSQCWREWHMGLAGVMPYPPVPPIAPPRPNIPAPLMILPSVGEASLSPTMLSARMLSGLSTPRFHAKQLFDSVARAFYTMFQMFKGTTMITGSMASVVTLGNPGVFK